MRKLLIALYGTKEKTAIWFFGLVAVLIFGILKEDYVPYDWNIFQWVIIALIIFDLFISFWYFGKYPLSRTEMSDKQKRAADSYTPNKK